MKNWLDDIEISKTGEVSEEDLRKALGYIKQMKAARKEKMLSSGVKCYTLTKEEYQQQRIAACKDSKRRSGRLELKVEVLSELFTRGYSVTAARAKYFDLYD